MWCVPQLDQEYLQRMEAVLEVLNRPLDKHAPVVALDERPVQLVDSLRPDTPMVPGRPARRDYEYARCGTANVFCVVEPKTGRHQTHATKNRTATHLRERSSGSHVVIPSRAPFIWCWIIASGNLAHRRLRCASGTPAVEEIHGALHPQTR